MACHDIVPLGHNASASGHAEGTAPDSDGLWEAAGLAGTGSSLGLSSRGFPIGIGRERGNIGIGKEREAFF